MLSLSKLIVSVIAVASISSRTSKLVADAAQEAVADCSKYGVVSGGGRAQIVRWKNGGPDSEWMDTNNWAKIYLPGSKHDDRIIMAAGDVAKVTCPATYMLGNIKVEMRARATLDVSSDLKIGLYLSMIGASVVTQTLGGTVTVGTGATLSASFYNLMSGASLEVAGDMTLNSQSKISVQQEGGASFSAENLELNSSTLHVTLDLTNASAAGTVRSALTVPNSATLTVDATAYASIAGTVRVPLIKFGSVVGNFAPANVFISGLPETSSALIDMTSSSVDIVISNDGTPATKSPTMSPDSTSTDSPTSSPVKTSTSVPTETPRDQCRQENDASSFFLKIKNGAVLTKNCAWLAKMESKGQNIPAKLAKVVKLCNSNSVNGNFGPAGVVCMETCEHYKRFFKQANKVGIDINKTCAWLAKPKRDTKRDAICAAAESPTTTYKSAGETCFETCKTCPPTNGPTMSPDFTSTDSPTSSPIKTSDSVPTVSPVATSTSNPTSAPIGSTSAPVSTDITERPTEGDCSGLALVGATNPITIQWTNEGQDSEWTNIDNWNKLYLPGSSFNDRIVMAINDVAVVNTCPATYMSGDIRLIMRAEATLDIESSDLTIGDYLQMDTGAVVTQTGPGGTVNIGNDLTLTGSTYKLMGGDVVLNVGGDLTLNENSNLIIQGDGSSFTAQNLILKDATSIIDMTLRPNVPVVPGVVLGTFTPNGGKLTVDASAYSNSDVTRIPLIKFQSMDGTFAPANVLILGGLTGAIDITADSLDFVVGATLAPAFTIDYTMTVSLTANGHDPFVVGSQDVIIDPNSAGLVIDGSDYTAGAGIIPILDWSEATSRYGRFEPKTVLLRKFATGLWFELQYTDDQIQLVIKRLSDYSEYWGDRFTNEDIYDEETDQSGFPAEYSWEKVPRWMNIRKNQAFKQSELKTIANKNAIVKVASLAGKLTNEEGSVDTTEKLKILNQSLVTICYWNSMVYWGLYKAFEPELPESWLRWVYKNGQWVLLTQGNAKNPRKFYNQDVPEMRKWWTDSAVSMVSEDSFDGIFIDKAADPRTEMTAGHRQMITELAQEIKNIPKPRFYMGNALRQMALDGSRDRLKYMNGSYMENWAWGVNCNPRSTANPNPGSAEYCKKENWDKNTADWQPTFERVTVSIQLAREALSKKKMILFTSGPWGCGHPCDMTEQETKEKISMPMAIFLMIAEPHAYLNYQHSALYNKDPALQWQADSSNLPEFNNNLGEPKGPPIKIGNTFARSFEHLTVTVDLFNEIATLDWHAN